MTAARTLLALAAVSLSAGCGIVTAPQRPTPAAPERLVGDRLIPSPRLIVGRILAVDPARGFAFVDLAAEAPAAALAPGTELVVRTLDLRETARLRTSPHTRGRTLGTTVLAGQPGVGEEVVWLAP